MADDPFDMPVVIPTGDLDKDDFIRGIFAKAGMTDGRFRTWLEEVKAHAQRKGVYREISEEEAAAEEGLTVEEYRSKMRQMIERIEPLFPKVQ